MTKLEEENLKTIRQIAFLEDILQTSITMTTENGDKQAQTTLGKPSDTFISKLKTVPSLETLMNFSHYFLEI